MEESCLVDDSHWMAVSSSVKNQQHEIEGNVAHFYPCKVKGEYFQKLCTDVLLPSNLHIDVKSTVWKYTYTAGNYFFCTKVNLALASDSPKGLQEHAQYICELMYCIKRYGEGFDGVLYRGVNLSTREVTAYEETGDTPFYIPSFTSASTTNGFEQKNTLIRIHCKKNKGFALKIREEWTPFPDEHEVLLCCYNVYKRMGDIKQEKKQDGTVRTVIDLELLDYKYRGDFNNISLPSDALKKKKFVACNLL